MSEHTSSETVSLSLNSVLALFLGLFLSLGYAALQGAAIYSRRSQIYTMSRQKRVNR